jgi:hypothetical protein
MKTNASALKTAAVTTACIPRSKPILTVDVATENEGPIQRVRDSMDVVCEQDGRVCDPRGRYECGVITGEVGPLDEVMRRRRFQWDEAHVASRFTSALVTTWLI